MSERDSALVVKGGRVWTGTQLEAADVRIVDGVIDAVGGDVAAGGDVLDASGALVLPGLVDVHVHLREPGYEEAEDVATGSEAAAVGGFCDIVVMPNTTPAIDTSEIVRSVRATGDARGLVRVHPSGCVTKNRTGDELAEIGEMYREGVRIFTDDGSPVANTALMRRALEYVRAFGGVVADHCEDPALTAGAQMHEGEISGRLGLRGWPAAAEEVMVARDIVLADAASARIHLQHISTALSVDFVRMAKARRVPVTAEVTTHHLFLTDDLAETFDPVYKVNPPIRSKDHVEALREALADGTIDAVATDHAPHTPENKDEWTQALPGMLGLETSLALVYSLHREGTLSLERLIDAMVTKPLDIAGLGTRGPIRPGEPADICVFDPDRRWTVEPERLCSKATNTPYAGLELTGRVRHTICGGVPTCRDAVPAATPSRARPADAAGGPNG